MSILFVFAWVFRMFAYEMRNLQGHSRSFPTIYSLHLEFYMFAHSIVNMICINMFFPDVCAWNICCIYRGNLDVCLQDIHCIYMGILHVCLHYHEYIICIYMVCQDFCIWHFFAFTGHSRCLPMKYCIYMAFKMFACATFLAFTGAC